MRLETVEQALTGWDAHGLTVAQVRLLLYLAEHSGSSAGAAAHYLGLPPPAVSSLLHRLERRGLIHRHRSAVDRRGIVIELQERGHALLALPGHD